MAGPRLSKRNISNNGDSVDSPDEQPGFACFRFGPENSIDIPTKLVCLNDDEFDGRK